MIRLSTSRGIEFVAAENIARITEAGVSSQWHGVRAIVRLFDGGVIEAQESAQDIARLLAVAPEALTPPAPKPLTPEDVARFVNQAMSNNLVARQRYEIFAQAVWDEALRRMGVQR